MFIIRDDAPLHADLFISLQLSQKGALSFTRKLTSRTWLESFLFQEVAVFRVGIDVARNEFAAGDNLPMAGSDIVERAASEL